MKAIVVIFAAAIALTASQRSTSGQADAVAAGRKLFRNECATCHGAEAVGTPKAPSLRSQRVQEAPDDALFRFLTNGRLKHGMPSWSRMPEERRRQIVAYLKSL